MERPSSPWRSTGQGMVRQADSETPRSRTSRLPSAFDPHRPGRAVRARQDTPTGAFRSVMRSGGVTRKRICPIGSRSFLAGTFPRESLPERQFRSSGLLCGQVPIQVQFATGHLSNCSRDWPDVVQAMVNGRTVVPGTALRKAVVATANCPTDP